MGSLSSALLGLDGTAGLRGWQWLFLVQGLPAVLMGVILVRFLPAAPATATWLTEAEKKWIQRELERDRALIGEPVRHNLLAPFANPKVLLLGLICFLLNGSCNALLLSAPAVLSAGTGLDTLRIGYVVTSGGILGVMCVLFAGWYSDRKGDRMWQACAYEVVVAVGLLLLGLNLTPVLVGAGYLLFAATIFASGVLVVSAWADVLPARELAVGFAAINTMGQIGNFASPYAFGLAKDATGDFRAGLIGSAVMAMFMAGLLLYLRAIVKSESRLRALKLAAALEVS
jgi:ACS family tartrate transporter-like MFS transporter